MTTDNQKNFNEILAALTAALGCEPLSPEEDGRVLFALDDNLGCALFPFDAEEAGNDGVMASLVVGPVPPDNTELLWDLLTGNYMGAEAGAGTLSIERESGMLVVSRPFDLPIDAAAFVEAFASLAGAARAWRDRLAVVAGDVQEEAHSVGDFMRV